MLFRSRFEEARIAIQQGMQADPGDPAVWATQALLEWKLGNGDGARKAIASLRKASGDSNGPLFNLIGVHWGDRALVMRFLQEYTL